MSNEELGKIADIDDSANRNIVETGIQRKKGNKILNLVLASLAGLVVFGLAGYYILSPDNSDPALEGIEVKKDEALLNPADSNSSNSLAAQMEAIKRQQAEDAVRQRKQNACVNSKNNRNKLKRNKNKLKLLLV